MSKWPGRVDVNTLPDDLNEAVRTLMFYTRTTESARQQAEAFGRSLEKCRQRVRLLGIDPDEAVATYYVPSDLD